MRYLIALMVAVMFAGCASGVTKITPTEGGLAQWTQKWRAFGPAEIHESAQKFHGEFHRDGTTLDLTIDSGQDVALAKTDLTPDMITAIGDALALAGFF